jgi:microcystin-dependent protein
MAFNFPNAPTLNQVFTPTAGVSYVWNGTQWDRLGAAAMAMPAGVWMPYGGFNAPLGWLFCDGRAVLRSAYPLLFAAIDVNYGPGDGSTTFNLPDMRGRTAFGRDNMGGSPAGRITSTGVGSSSIDGNVLGANGGADRRAMTVAQIPAHAHTGSGTSDINNVGHTHTGLTGLENQNHTHYISGYTDTHGGHDHTTNSFYSGGASGSTNFSAASPVQNKSARAIDVGGAHNHTINFASGTVSANHNHYFTTDGQSANHTHTYSFTTSSIGGSEAYPMLPPTLIANYIIFAGM